MEKAGSNENVSLASGSLIYRGSHGTREQGRGPATYHLFLVVLVGAAISVSPKMMERTSCGEMTRLGASKRTTKMNSSKRVHRGFGFHL